MTAVLVRRFPNVHVTVRQWCMALVGVIVAAELLGRVVPAVSLAVHAAIIVTATVRTARPSTTTARADGTIDRVLGALAVVSIVRFGALAATSSEWPALVSIVLVGVVALTAVWAAADQISYSIRPQLRFPAPVPTILLCGAGLVLGEVLYLILDLSPTDTRLVDQQDTGWVVTFATLIVLLVFVGFVDELVYRGLLQTALVHAFGAPGVVLAAAIYGAGVAGWASVRWGVAIGIVALLFGWIRRRTGSIIPTAILHGFMAYALVEVWPGVF